MEIKKNINLDCEFFKKEMPKLIPENLKLKEADADVGSMWIVKRKGIFGRELMSIFPTFFGSVEIFVKDESAIALAKDIGEHYEKARRGQCIIRIP